MEAFINKACITHPLCFCFVFFNEEFSTWGVSNLKLPTLKKLWLLGQASTMVKLISVMFALFVGSYRTLQPPLELRLWKQLSRLCPVHKILRQPSQNWTRKIWYFLIKCAHHHQPSKTRDREKMKTKVQPLLRVRVALNCSPRTSAWQ